MRGQHASSSDTIVACATPPGEGGVAVVRLSGPRALELGRTLAPARRPRESHRLATARIHAAQGTVIDQGMVVEMHAPRSYTGEDVVELHLHGSRAIVAAVLDAAQAHGARLAGPGEFTLRAFLHGRMDLSQAEAVASLIAATDAEQLQAASNLLAGQLAKRVGELLEALEEVLAAWRAALDFPEHPTGEGLSSEQLPRLRETLCKIQELCRGAGRLRTGARRVVLCGAPNVGKSSLVNAWLGEERVLVDAAPGTTRDPVEVDLSAGGVRWSIWDTAGIRAAAEGLEARGIALAREQMARADVAVWLVSAEAVEWPAGELGVVVVGSKADLASPARRREVEAEAARRGSTWLGWVSAQTGEGLTALRERLRGGEDVAVRGEGHVVVRERHLACLRAAEGALLEVLEGLASGLTLDVLASTLEGAVRALGEILGRDVDAELLERVFADFCIGK